MRRLVMVLALMAGLAVPTIALAQSVTDPPQDTGGPTIEVPDAGLPPLDGDGTEGEQDGGEVEGEVGTEAVDDELRPLGRDCKPDPNNDVLFCEGDDANRVPSFDKVPLDVDVTLPEDAKPGVRLPTIVIMHGYGGGKGDFEAEDAEGDDTREYHYNNIFYAERGYAVVNYSARGFDRSCGQPSSRAPVPVGADCTKGWIHLADQRFEARDTQLLLGKLVDEDPGLEGRQDVADPNNLGVTGLSYGGGQTLELAYLRDQIRLENDSFEDWVSPITKTRLKIKAAYARWPWSDLVASLVPNGRFLDDRGPPEEESRNPIGVAIQSYIEGLFALGAANGYYAPVGVDPDSDLSRWNARIAAGEPYEGTDAEEIADEIFKHHGAFALPDGRPPAPMLIQNGWTDDLFPPQHALRVYNDLDEGRGGTPVTLQFGDLGHPRGSNRPDVDRDFNDEGADFFDARLKNDGDPPDGGSARAYAQSCDGDPSDDGPFEADSWKDLRSGDLAFGDDEPQLVTSADGDPSVGGGLDPIGGGGDACKDFNDAQSSENNPNTAVYRGPSDREVLMIGLPTVCAQVQTTGDFGQLDSRLWDVDTVTKKQVLVARGTYRLKPDQRGQIKFQLNGNGWRFKEGHEPKLELLGRDAPYLRPSNGTFELNVSNLNIALPGAESPCADPDSGNGDSEDRDDTDGDGRGGNGNGSGSGGNGGRGGSNGGNGDGDSGESPAPPSPVACIVARLGGPGPDRVFGTLGGDSIMGMGGADRLFGLAGDDCLFGGGGNDRLSGAAGNDRLSGAAGNDVLRGGPGTNAYSGGAGNDRLYTRDDAAQTVFCGTGRDTAWVDVGDTPRGCERVLRPRR